MYRSRIVHVSPDVWHNGRSRGPPYSIKNWGNNLFFDWSHLRFQMRPQIFRQETVSPHKLLWTITSQCNVRMELPSSRTLMDQSRYRTFGRREQTSNTVRPTPSFQPSVSIALQNGRGHAHFNPRQLRGPREKATSHFSRSLPAWPTHRSGRKAFGLLKISPFRCTKWLLISTTVCGKFQLANSIHKNWLTPPGMNLLFSSVPEAGTTRGSGDATPGLILSDSLTTALLFQISDGRTYLALEIRTR